MTVIPAIPVDAVIGHVCGCDDLAPEHAQQRRRPRPRALLRDQCAIGLDPKIRGQRRRMLDAKGLGDPDRALGC